MVNLRIVIDDRHVPSSGECVVKLSINKQRKTAYLPLSVRVRPEHWDKSAGRVLGNTGVARSANRYLLNTLNTVTMYIHDAQLDGKFATLSAAEIRDKISQFLNPSTEAEDDSTFVGRFRAYIDRCNRPRTRDIYSVTLKKVQQYAPDASRLSFEDITREWLLDFDRWLPSSGCVARNARNIHLRNIRAVFNDAIDSELTTNYPFRRLSIRPEATVKRAASVDDLRAFFATPCDRWQKKYVDAFKLIFCLIGINVADLLAADPPTDGRLIYRRAKTGRLYNIKIEPEAAALIHQYRGQKRMVSWGEQRKDHRTFTMALDREIKRIGEHDGIAPFATFTSYTARHSWATIAASLDIPKETIAHALGHGGGTVTDIYIDFDDRKVDEANRRVLDFVFYGKK